MPVDFLMPKVRFIEEKIKQEAQKLGFDLVRITEAQKFEKDTNFLKTWLKKGYAGSMDYLKKDPEKRGDPEKILPGTKSIICLGLNYFQQKPSGTFQIARYALGRDYHKVISKKLKKLCALLELKSCGNTGGRDNAKTKSFVDAGPVFDRAWSSAAGLGFMGKNTCLITREFGSYIFLAEIFTTLSLKPDPPSQWKGSCGSCRRCINICPTKAIQEDRSIDSTKCISYLTIENRGPIPKELREKIGTWLFGCDLCQEICPHNVRAQPTRVEDFKNIRIGTTVHDLRKILEIKTDEEFQKYFAGTPLMRAKRRGLIRNACIVAGNLKEKSLLPSLKKLAQNDDEMLKEHAEWAIEKITVSTLSPPLPSSHSRISPSQKADRLNDLNISTQPMK